MKWFYLLNKRLLKKISFLILLGCIPLLVLGVNFMSGQDSGMLRIVLAGEGQQDELADRVMEELKGQDSMVQFLIADSARQAEEMRMSILGKDSKTKDPKPLEVVDVYIRENTMEVIDPLGTEKKMQELKEKNDTLINELNTKIKISNATTVVEF